MKFDDICMSIERVHSKMCTWLLYFNKMNILNQLFQSTIFNCICNMSLLDDLNVCNYAVYWKCKYYGIILDHDGGLTALVYDLHFSGWWEHLLRVYLSLFITYFRSICMFLTDMWIWFILYNPSDLIPMNNDSVQ